ncbi:MAG: hypothetical protein RL735_2102, partial [Pseudomonadota bacterium]
MAERAPESAHAPEGPADAPTAP